MKMSDDLKQYLLCVDTSGMNALSSLFKGLQFIEVKGLDIKDEPKFKLLANPQEPPKEAVPE